MDVEVLPNQEATSRVAEGRLDAALINLNTSPPPDYTIAAVRAGMRLLEIKGPGVERLRLRHPFLVRTLIPPGTYPNQDKAIRTIGVDLLLLCRADFDDELAYEFMKAYFEVLARVNVAIDLDRAPAMAIPLHPSAVRYYRERELAQ
jgi:TRAP transporter TAXI family solute receptor